MKEKEREQKKKELKEQLKKQMGNISLACKKVGISRNSYYRWKKEDKEWGKEMDEIKEEKDNEMNDFTEGKLYEKIHNGDRTSIIFYLKTRHPKYRRKQDVNLKGELKTNDIELNDEERELLNRAIKFAYNTEEDSE